MIWESQQSNSKNPENNENYTKHYVYEPKSFVPLLQTGYTGFIKLLETPDYVQFKHEDYSVYKVIYAELSGDFPLGDSRQPTYKSLRPFDLVS